MAAATSATLTVTGKTGAGLTMTAQVFTGVTSYNVNAATHLLSIVQGPVVTQVDINAATTFTTTITAGNYAVTIS